MRRSSGDTFRYRYETSLTDHRVSAVIDAAPVPGVYRALSESTTPMGLGAQCVAPRFPLWIDNVGIAFYTGHASASGFTFTSAVDDGFLHFNEARWGNYDLEWLVIAAPRSK